MFDAIIHLDTALTLFFNGSDCLWLDNFIFNATKTVVWIPLFVAMAFVACWRLGWKQGLLAIAGAGLCVLIADQVASGLCKPLFERLRPTHEPALEGLVDIVNGYRGGHYGFFSSHAANTVAVATFLSLILRHRLTAVSLYAWALLNCWTRVYLGVHYIGDLLAGTLFGLFTGWLVARIFSLIVRRCKLPDSPVSVAPDAAWGAANAISLVFLLSLLCLAVVAIP